LKEKVIKTYIEDEMKSSYLTYAMSVIVSRALPDVRDGLKPVHRRILYSMHELGLLSDKPFKKSARVVGDVLGKFHPHGDQAVYDALVRMAQDFSMRYPLIDGQGNFGSIDGDSPAAMRYTEVRLKQIAELMLKDIEKETVDFIPNFDDTMKEPSVLPSAFPNLLVNGSSGIAVGMATNIPPHNMVETINAIIAVIKNPKISIKKVMQIIPGPDFPTGGIIVGSEGIEKAYTTGNGQIKLRAKVNIEKTTAGKEIIVVNEIPYQVNKSRLIQTIASYVKERKIDGITDIRDESDRDGLRIVFELKRGVYPKVIMNQLFKMTPLEITYGINLLALDGMRPVVMNIKELIQKYIEHRVEIVRRRTRFDLEKAEKRAHILEGFIKALDNIDEIIQIIKKSKNPKEAGDRLIARFSFSKEQADAILEMRLARLTALERDMIEKEYEYTVKLIKKIKEILKNRKNILNENVKELKEISKKFGDERRTVIIDEEEEVRLEDLIVEEDVVVTISHRGFIKRTPISAFRHQSRGGVGVNTSSLKEDDFIEHMFVASTHDRILFITNRGRAYSVNVHEIVSAGKGSKGQSIDLLLNMNDSEKVASYVVLRSKHDADYLLFLTKNGYVKKVDIGEFENIRKTGIIAIGIPEEDQVIDAITTNGEDELIIATSMGNALRIKESAIRAMGRSARGVIGIKLQEGDEVCGFTKVVEGASMLVVTENGFGKRIEYKHFSVHGRGTKGQKYFKLTGRTGKASGILSISNKESFVIITERGMMLKIRAKDIPFMGKNASGVRIVTIKDGDRIADVARIVE